MKSFIANAIVVGLMLSGAAVADTWTVDDDGPADFSSIQAAVSYAGTGDIVEVMPGVYQGGGAAVVDLEGKSIWLRSTHGADVTIIHGQGARRGIYSSGGDEPVIVEGFGITGGFSTAGGGVGFAYSSAVVIDCKIYRNNSGGENGTRGGGVYVIGNESDYCQFINTSITSNHVNNPMFGVDVYGGGAYVTGASALFQNCHISNNTLTGNSNAYGGALYSDTSAELIATTVCGNTLPEIGGQWSNSGYNCLASSCNDSNGDGTPDECTSPPQLGACCLGATCEVTTSQNCNGVWTSEIQSCVTANCGIGGACCTIEGCVEGGDQSTCLIYAGDWQGVGGKL